MAKSLLPALVLMALALVSAHSTAAQIAAFTYQGRLTDASAAANGPYDMQFILFDSVGGQIGGPVVIPGVVITSGTFTVRLNGAGEFGPNAFDGGARFLEIYVRHPGGGAYTVLSPRQEVTSSPYSVYSSSAATATSSTSFTGPLLGDVTGTQSSSTVARINGSPLGATTGATTGQVLTWNGTDWAKSTAAGVTGTGVANTVTKFTSPTVVGNSSITDDGTTVTTTGQLDVTGGTGTVYNTAPIEIRTSTPRIGFHWPGVVASQLGMDSSGVIRTYNNPGTGYEQFAASNIYANGFLSIAGPADAAGNIRFSAANPYIIASSYFTAPGGAYFNSGTVYVQAQAQFRGGIHNDTNTYLQIDGGTSGITYLPGSLGLGTTNPQQYKLNVTDAANGGLRVSTGTSGGTVASFGGLGDFVIDAPGVAGGRLTVKESGNVGIGTNTPTAPLGFPAAIGKKITLYPGATGDAGLGVFGNEMRIASDYSGADITFGYDDRTNGFTERMTLKGTGSLGLGIINPNDRLQVIGDIRVGTGGTNGCIKNFGGGVIGGTCSSDAKFKDRITPFGPTLQKLSMLNPVHFYWRSNEFPEKAFGRERSYGLIAQEVEQAFPEIVSTDAEGFRMVDYSKLPLLTIQAVKELKLQNDRLEERVQQQEESIRQLLLLVCLEHKEAKVCQK
ncbi:MAG: tail fiber domain-containing protein [Pyrinomonadaceae bacterium]